MSNSDLDLRDVVCDTPSSGCAYVCKFALGYIKSDVYGTDLGNTITCIFNVGS